MWRPRILNCTPTDRRSEHAAQDRHRYAVNLPDAGSSCPEKTAGRWIRRMSKSQDQALIIGDGHDGVMAFSITKWQNGT